MSVLLPLEKDACVMNGQTTKDKQQMSTPRPHASLSLVGLGNKVKGGVDGGIFFFDYLFAVSHISFGMYQCVFGVDQ